RTTVALFVRFSGIDFEHSPNAQEQLDAYVRWVQGVLGRYDGVLLQVSLGDKGSYLYGTFGAPTVHEDDSRRAILAAQELQSLPAALSYMQPPSIGISRGAMRTGPIGSAERRAYAVMSDEANVAARLMEAAAPGEIVVTERVVRQLGGPFEVSALSPLKIK